MTTNLLVAVYLARKWEDDPVARIKLLLRIQSWITGYRGAGNKAKRRAKGSAR